MKYSKLILCLITLLMAIPVMAQVEICDDGIDNDGDGLIDFQDDNCHCDGISSFFVSSVIPNPSFEDQLQCPLKQSQLNYAEHWNQATDATTDYLSECGWMGDLFAVPPLPFPNGNSCVGLVPSGLSFDKDTFTYQEYLGTNLLKNLQKDTAYTLEFSVGFGSPYFIINNDTIWSVKTPPEITLAIYVNQKKTNFPLKTSRCISKTPNYDDDWEVVGKIKVKKKDNSWVKVSMDFKPDNNYQSIIIGEECRTITDLRDTTYGYIFIDNLILSKSSNFNFGTPLKIGSTCSGNLKLKAPPINSIVAYQWYRDGIAIPAAINPELNLGDAVGKSGVYTVVISNTEGDCAESNPVTVNENNEYNIQGQYVLCAGDSMQLDAGTGFDFYHWSTGDTTQVITVAKGGNYSVSVNKANGCTGSDTITVKSIDIDLQGIVTDADYGETNGAIDVTVTGGEAPYNYQWSNNAATQDLNGIVGGQYILEVRDKNGCYASDTFTVKDIPKKLKVEITVSAVLCAGDSSGSIEINVNGGVPPYSIEWQDIDKNGKTVTGLSAGTYDFTIIDSLGTELHSSANVDEPESLLITVEEKRNPTCYASTNGRISLDVTGGVKPYSIQWNNSTSQSMQRTELPEGFYKATITDNNSCQAIKKIQLIAPNKLEAVIVPVDPACYGEKTGELRINSLTGGTKPYNFFLNGNQIKRNELLSLGQGDYTLKIEDENKCGINNSYTLTSPPYVEVQVNTSDAHLIEGDSTKINATVLPEVPEGFRREWKSNYPLEKTFCDSCMNLTIFPERTAQYEYRISNGYCLYSDFVTIQVDPIKVYTPNAFTPNEDGVNDRLIVGTNKEELTVSSFEVFNRWGERIYSVQNVPLKDFRGWDGTSHKQIQKPGNYMYIIDLVDRRGKHFQRKSTITILN